MRIKIRNKLTGFLFGKYNLESIATKKLVQKESYVSGVEIINYNEQMILSSIILMAIGILAGIFYPILLILVPFSFFLIFLSLDLELVMLTDERIIIEKKGLVEKLLGVNNEISLSLDQIAVISYGRSPFNKPAMITSIVSLLTLITYSTLRDSNKYFDLFILIPLFIITLYLVWWGLRLGKRSVELSIIGVLKNVGIGRNKGVPLWFLSDLQTRVFERIHHLFHEERIKGVKADILEYPLQYSSIAKHMINELHDPIHHHIIKFLDRENYTKKELNQHCPICHSVDMDEAIRYLRLKKFIYYDKSNKIWKLNREIKEEKK